MVVPIGTWSWSICRRTPAQGRVQLGWTDLSSRRWQFTDLLDPVSFEREGEELADPGLFVDLEPWRFHLFALD